MPDYIWNPHGPAQIRRVHETPLRSNDLEGFHQKLCFAADIAQPTQSSLGHFLATSAHHNACKPRPSKPCALFFAALKPGNTPSLQLCNEVGSPPLSFSTGLHGEPAKKK